MEKPYIRRVPPSEVEQIERDVIRLRLQGFTHKQVADTLHIKRHRVHDALMRVYRRLGVHSTEELYGEWFSQEGQ